MATQYIQKFDDAAHVPADTGKACGVGMVNGILTFNGTSGAGFNATTGAVKLNSTTFTAATGDTMGVQSKPDQTVTTTGNVYGVQSSPRVETGINANGIIGFSSQPIIKGTGSTIATDVRGYEAAIDLNVAGTPTVTGTVSALYAYLQAPSTGQRNIS